ncbi:radical SAM domain-containing protein [Candidatus Omnitrophus magneticus]|uniref:Radical SAM domain-containing protein n=1 Tax=Candidatus Omnitrophus magneticus TaxID=1609969 RepID=A0A0F0CPD0_9BACT|nr:radical SAM domain-containing protein [Candidatus Omnitrophus magneticus]
MSISSKLTSIEKVSEYFSNAYSACCLCYRACGVNRCNGKLGFCKAPNDAVIYSYYSHQGEEPPISGERGSGTIFFSYCALACVYCQNWQFSQTAQGKKVNKEELSDIMLELQAQGCHNINLVNPTHFLPSIIGALKRALNNGLNIPVVYNTGGYDSIDSIKALNGIIDVYLPDMRYSSNEFADKYSDAPKYVETNRNIIKEMYRQVGGLCLSKDDLAEKGLIIRLLVLPGGRSGTIDTLEFIAREIGVETYLSVMSQYNPVYRAKEFKEIDRKIFKNEYETVLAKMEELGFENGWVQPFEGDFDARFLGENFKSSWEKSEEDK